MEGNRSNIINNSNKTYIETFQLEILGSIFLGVPNENTFLYFLRAFEKMYFTWNLNYHIYSRAIVLTFPPSVLSVKNQV